MPTTPLAPPMVVIITILSKTEEEVTDEFKNTNSENPYNSVNM